MDLLLHGRKKFPNAGLIASSAGRGWRGVAAEVRAHPAGELAAVAPTQFELTFAVQGADGSVARKGAGIRQVTPVRPGTLWLCPIGVGEEDISMSANLPEILHVYLPCGSFSSLSQQYGGGRISGESICYLADVEDPLVQQLCLSLLAELRHETSVGRIFAETAALALAARLAQAYSHECFGNPKRKYSSVCETRIRRVLDYVPANLEADLSLEDLARIACLSPFHFARMFKEVVGKTPHGFVSEKRLELAKRLLAERSSCLAEVAIRSGFSSQAAFNRSFRRSEGCTPGEFMRRTGN